MPTQWLCSNIIAEPPLYNNGFITLQQWNPFLPVPATHYLHKRTALFSKYKMYTNSLQYSLYCIKKTWHLPMHFCFLPRFCPSFPVFVVRNSALPHAVQQCLSSITARQCPWCNQDVSLPCRICHSSLHCPKLSLLLDHFISFNNRASGSWTQR